MTGRPPRPAGPDGVLVRDFSELVEVIEARFDDERQDFVGEPRHADHLRILRRLGAMTTRLGHLIRLGVTAPHS